VCRSVERVRARVTAGRRRRPFVVVNGRSRLVAGGRQFGRLGACSELGGGGGGGYVRVEDGGATELRVREQQDVRRAGLVSGSRSSTISHRPAGTCSDHPRRRPVSHVNPLFIARWRKEVLENACTQTLLVETKLGYVKEYGRPFSVIISDYNTIQYK